jgi:hypothetical protein
MKGKVPWTSRKTKQRIEQIKNDVLRIPSRLAFSGVCIFALFFAL